MVWRGGEGEGPAVPGARYDKDAFIGLGGEALVEGCAGVGAAVAARVVGAINVEEGDVLAVDLDGF